MTRGCSAGNWHCDVWCLDAGGCWWMLVDAERGPQTYLSAAAAAGVFRSGAV